MKNYTPLDPKLLTAITPRQEKYPNLLHGTITNNGGAPTKYDPSYVSKLDEYLETAKFPCLEGFALFLGHDDTTLLNWANKRVKDENGDITNKLVYPEFFAAIKKLKMLQKKMLMESGLFGQANAYMAKFLLEANHNMVIKSNLDVTTKGKELPTPLLGGLTNVSKSNGTEQTIKSE